MDRRVATSSETPRCPPRLPRRQRIALAVVVLLWTIALVLLLIAPSLRR
jgi:hypothetical protein